MFRFMKSLTESSDSAQAKLEDYSYVGWHPERAFKGSQDRGITHMYWPDHSPTAR